MFCRNCGAEIKPGNRFCIQCGTPVEKAEAMASVVGRTRDGSQREEEGKTVPADQPDGRKLPIVPITVGTVVLLLVIGLGSFFFFHRRENSGPADTAFGENAETITDENLNDNLKNTTTDWQDMIPLYVIEDVPSINIHAQNYAAGVKAPGIAWDNTLFYWLEDVDQTSTEDGYLAKCLFTKMLLRNVENGNIIQYEIYRDPNSDEIYKIVSIEQTGAALQLVDYYYQGGVPNFTFSRYDSVYTPTYATPAKVGERYYFNGDVMAKWRMIREPNVIGEYVLAPTEVNYSQADYFAESTEFQAIYDNTELRELNAARNTFDAVTTAGNGIGMVEGRVSDTAGNPVVGVTVDILRAEDGILLYRTVTDENGSFSIFVYLEDVECSIVIRGNETFDSNSIQGVMLARSNGGSSYGNILMHRIDGDEYPIHINVYSAVDVRTGEGGSLQRDLLPDAKVSLRTGADSRTGEILQTLKSDENSYLNTALSSGTYTAQVDVPGYATSYLTIEVMEQETTAEVYMLPALAANQTGIVMTWEGSADLDLTLFTPYQSTNGDMAHIGGRITEDDYGNSLVADNTAGCEVMYVNTAVPGNYKLYVNNYTESTTGNYSSGQLSALNIHIYIYDSNGLIVEYSFPAGQIGVVWEVADINSGQVTPSQRVYVSLEGKSWWTENKAKIVLVQESTYIGGDGSLVHRYEYGYDAMGNMVRQTAYNNDGSIMNRNEYSYDAVGNMVQWTLYSSDGNIIYWNEYNYDTKGNEVRRTNYNSDGSISWWSVNSYDVMGNMVQWTVYDSDRKIAYWYEYSYDAMGNKVKETHCQSDGSIYEWYEYSYDEIGNMVREILYYSDSYDLDGSFWEWKEYSYDAKGHKVRETFYDNDGNIYEWYEYSYDEMGNEVRETHCYNNNNVVRISGWNEHSYDAMGNEVRKTYYHSDGSILQWDEYMYAPLNAG